MGNPRGQAARFAYDPAVFALYIEHKTTYVRKDIEVQRNGKTRKQHATLRYINGVHLDQGDDARRLLRWRTNTRGITKKAATEFLGRHDLTTEQFERWAKASNLRAVLWNRLND